jgi:hypothetical protein
LFEILNSLVSKSHAAAATTTDAVTTDDVTTDAGVAVAAEEGRSEFDITLLR